MGHYYMHLQVATLAISMDLPNQLYLLRNTVVMVVKTISNTLDCETHNMYR